MYRDTTLKILSRLLNQLMVDFYYLLVTLLLEKIMYVKMWKGWVFKTVTIALKGISDTQRKCPTVQWNFCGQCRGLPIFFLIRNFFLTSRFVIFSEKSWKKISNKPVCYFFQKILNWGKISNKPVCPKPLQIRRPE